MSSTTDEILTVLAHGWLGSMSVVVGAAETLRDDGERLTPAQRQQLLSMMAMQARHLAEEMRQLVAASNPEVQAALDELLARSEER